MINLLAACTDVTGNVITKLSYCGVCPLWGPNYAEKHYSLLGVNVILCISLWEDKNDNSLGSLQA